MRKYLNHLKTPSVIVNDFVSVYVILLPELCFEGVEEGVGAVLKHDTLHPEAVVLQPALISPHQPGPYPGHLPTTTTITTTLIITTTTTSACPHRSCPGAPHWDWSPRPLIG